jgi:hypothetical protein
VASRAAAGAVVAAALMTQGCAHGELDRFAAVLARHDSATLALQEWCAARGIAQDAPILAQQVRGEDAAVPADLAALLGSAEQPGYRHVRLTCGQVVLSEAHNWYLPTLLSPGMNRQLDTSDTPFGKVAAPLGFHRETLETRRGVRPGCPADTVLWNRALLRLPDGRPLAVLVECYTKANLGR